MFHKRGGAAHPRKYWFLPRCWGGSGANRTSSLVHAIHILPEPTMRRIMSGSPNLWTRDLEMMHSGEKVTGSPPEDLQSMSKKSCKTSQTWVDTTERHPYT